MSERISERDIRIQKAQTLKSLGINPYAQSWDKNIDIGKILEKFTKFKQEDRVTINNKTKSLRDIEKIKSFYEKKDNSNFFELNNPDSIILNINHIHNHNTYFNNENFKLTSINDLLKGENIFIFLKEEDSKVPKIVLTKKKKIINFKDIISNSFSQQISISDIVYQIFNIDQINIESISVSNKEEFFGRNSKIFNIDISTKERIIKLNHKLFCLIDQKNIISKIDSFEDKYLLGRYLYKEEKRKDILEKINFSIAGRIVLKRVSGKLAFGQIMDETGQIQLMWEHQSTTLLGQTPGHDAAKKELQGESNKPFDYWFIDKLLDVGDIIGVKGELFVTHKGELTMFVSEYQLLSKAIRPLGDKFHGIGEDNQETAYRQRYLDMIFNRESLERMKLRSTFVKTLREFYRANGFMELDTPILGNSASGAAAAPFVTHHNDFDTDMYLRIAPEIALKMATVGGLERVFEIGKDFRNEGSSPSHHQEFLVAEHYAMYWNYEDNMRFTEQMFNHLFDHIPQLSRTIKVADKQGVMREVTFGEQWERIDYIERIKADSGVDVSQFGADDDVKLRELIKSKGHDRQGLDIQTTATMIDYLYKKVTRPKILGPAFIYNYPKTMQPLARTSDADDQIVEQFQAIINGWEILKAYSELVDPVELQANFDAQADALARGDDEATSSDDEFVLSMEYGMAPQSGWGMGLDRILAMLTEQANIRDVIMFPMMKPELQG